MTSGEQYRKIGAQELTTLAFTSFRIGCSLALLAAQTVALADEQAPKSLREAVALERRDALPLTSFYDPPEPLKEAEPGTLIRKMNFAGYSVPVGVTAVRILYHSRTVAGRDIAVSGVVLIPKGLPPTNGWPILAWAHGTSGVARHCAPSLMKDLAYGDEGLMPMVTAGFAVVATDYAGLGTPTQHAYLNKIPQANDVIYSIGAARKAIPELGAKWVAIGHSQGGIAVWGIAEQEARLRDSGYLGGISVAGYMDFEGWAADKVVADPENAFFWAFEAFGIKSSYPTFDVNAMLTPAIMTKYEAATSRGCFYYASEAYKALGKVLPARAGWAKAPEVRRYLHDSQSADKAIRGPLLIVAGDEDHIVPIESVKKSVAHACELGLPIEFRHRPGLEHDPVMYDMTPYMLAWARDRMDGKPWVGNCPPL
jgi:pimeloyl-ACP methyl ester carboxylesterase